MGKETKGKATRDTAKKKKRKRAASEKNVSFIKLERGLHRGGSTVKRYSRSLVAGFNDFTAGKYDEKIHSFIHKKANWLTRLRFSGFVVGSLLLLVFMLLLFNNTSIKIDECTISVAGLSPELEGYRIVLLSDMHGREFGSNQATLLRSLNGSKYNLMILAGDMVGKDGNAEPLYNLLDGLVSTSPVYFIAGDSDPGPLLAEPRETEGEVEKFVLEDWVLGAIEHGAIYLDAPVSIAAGKSSFWLTPESMLDTKASPLLSELNAQYRLESAEVVEGIQASYKALPFTAYRIQCAQELLDAVNVMDNDKLHIAVAHYPPVEEYNPASGYSDSGMLRTVDLVLAGHYCGGGWKIPGVGAFYIPAVEAPRHGWFPDQGLVEGLRTLGNVNVYTTGGLSMTDKIKLPGVRLSNQPKITVITLTAALTDDLLGIN